MPATCPGYTAETGKAKDEEIIPLCTVPLVFLIPPPAQQVPAKTNRDWTAHCGQAAALSLQGNGKGKKPHSWSAE